jgi:hypothetical protein
LQGGEEGKKEVGAKEKKAKVEETKEEEEERLDGIYDACAGWHLKQFIHLNTITKRHW